MAESLASHKFSTQTALCRAIGLTVVNIALRYKAEGRGFDSRQGHHNFSLT
jgi:hypothetical protein